MMRMLTLQQRSLVSDRPLPVRSPAGAASTKSMHTAPEQHIATCPANATTLDGYPGISQWASRFATQEHATFFAPHRADFSNFFAATTNALHDGHFSLAQDKLYRLCMHGRDLAQALRAGTQSTADAAADAGILEHWVGDCSTLLHYVPKATPSREDHKRLLMLLHDLGGSLLLLYLLGALSAPLLPIQPLTTLANALGNSFGEWNRKTALTRALGVAERSEPE